MQNKEVLEIIEKLSKGKRKYEERKANKFGYTSLYDYVLYKLETLETKLTPINQVNESKSTSKTQTDNINFANPSQQQLNTLSEYYQNGRYSDSEKLALSITQKFPEHQFAWKVLGAVIKQTGRISESLLASQKSVQLKPLDSEAHNNLSVTLIELVRLDEAEASLRQAIALKPDFAEAHNNLGFTLQELSRLDEAEASYKQAIVLNPNYTEAYNNMGNTLKELGRLDEAKASYKRAIVLNTDYAEAHNNLGVTLDEMGRLDEAKASYKQAIVLNTDYAEARSNLGNTLHELGRLDEAEASLRRAIALKPDFPEAHSNLGITLHELVRMDEAEASLRQAIALKPDYAEAHNNLGVTLYELGKLEEAIDSYKKALSIKPEYAEVWNNILFPLQAIKMHISSPDKFLFDFFNEIKSKSEEIIKYILNYKLNRGEGISNALLIKVINAISKAKNITIKNPTINKKLISLDHVLPEKIIALVHFGRSGTGLLHSLIDGHKETSSLPSIYFSEYFDHSTWKKITANGWHGMADSFIANYEVLFDATSIVGIETKGKKNINKIGYKEGMTNVGNNQDEVLSLDKKLFRKELIYLMESQKILDAFIFFKLIHIAYERAIKNHNQKNLIFYHIHNPDTYAQLNFVRSAPNANWVMTVREPIQSLESWLKNPFMDNDYSQCSVRIVTMLLEIDNIIYKTQKSIGVRLEDLKKYPKKTIPALCQWMGIEENESLYEMTAQGKKWWGDPSSPNYSTEGMNPFGKNAINREVGSIFSEDDQFILRTLFYPFSLHFGYIEPNFEKFKDDLQTTRTMLDKMFDFERTIVERTHGDPNTFIKSGSYLYLRSILIDRWNILNKFYTYPYMIQPLQIN